MQLVLDDLNFCFCPKPQVIPCIEKNEAQNALRQRKWCLKQSRWTAELEYATSTYQIWNINIKYKLWISNTKQAIDPIDCRVKILPTHHACQCGKKENKKWRLNKYCKLTMPMWANGRRMGSRRVWYCKQLRICSANNIFYFIKDISGNIIFPFCFHFVFYRCANLRAKSYEVITIAGSFEI